MSNTTNVAIAASIETKANELSEKRVKWEEGTYKRSNDELYALLSDCLDFYQELKGEVTKCKALNDYLRRNNIAFKESASLETRTVRAVFGSSFQKRAYGYARVISIAEGRLLKRITDNAFVLRHTSERVHSTITTGVLTLWSVFRASGECLSLLSYLSSARLWRVIT